MRAVVDGIWLQYGDAWLQPNLLWYLLERTLWLEQPRFYLVWWGWRLASPSSWCNEVMFLWLFTLLHWLKHMKGWWVSRLILVDWEQKFILHFSVLTLINIVPANVKVCSHTMPEQRVQPWKLWPISPLGHHPWSSVTIGGFLCLLDPGNVGWRWQQNIWFVAHWEVHLANNPNWVGYACTASKTLQRWSRQKGWLGQACLNACTSLSAAPPVAGWSPVRHDNGVRIPKVDGILL